VNDMSTSMRGRLMQAAAADEAEHATGYGGYGGPSPYDNSGHSGFWSNDTGHSSRNTIDSDEVDDGVSPQSQTPPPSDDPDGSPAAAAPTRPTKNRAEAPVLLDDKHIYDVNEIGSLSTAGQGRRHCRCRRYGPLLQQR